MIVPVLAFLSEGNSSLAMGGDFGSGSSPLLHEKSIATNRKKIMLRIEYWVCH